ncbi:MAG TPA: DUF502 domain-containing protein [Longimicrobiales bacterium]|nr:DUF502 domain-containing protein [Longimicrobiales bacterium]
MRKFIQTTVLGGIAFLIPVVVVSLVVGTAVGWIRRVTDPIVGALPSGWTDHALAALAVAGLALLGVCFAAGLLARTQRAQRLVGGVESRVLARIPFYTVFKTRADAVLHAEEVGSLRPVLVRLDDAHQFGFEVERVQGDRITVYIPGAPDPWSGDVLVVDAERVSELDLGLSVIEKLCYQLGMGSGAALEEGFPGSRGHEA